MWVRFSAFMCVFACNQQLIDTMWTNEKHKRKKTYDDEIDLRINADYPITFRRGDCVKTAKIKFYSDKPAIKRIIGDEVENTYSFKQTDKMHDINFVDLISSY